MGKSLEPMTELIMNQIGIPSVTTQNCTFYQLTQKKITIFTLIQPMPPTWQILKRNCKLDIQLTNKLIFIRKDGIFYNLIIIQIESFENKIMIFFYFLLLKIVALYCIYC